jgi:hypothetical protein
MEESNNYPIHIKTNHPIRHIEEMNEVVNMICKMAKETENKILDEKKVTEAVQNFILNKMYGHYFLIVDETNKIFCGMNMITYEYNINTDKTLVWIQSVFIEKEYRLKKLFRKLLQENENFVKKNENFEKKVKLYMDKHNTTAEQVYDKLGFVKTDECLFEIDYDFDDAKFLRSEDEIYNKMNINLMNDGISMSKLTIDKFEKCDSKIKYSNFSSKISNRKVDLNNYLNSIRNVLYDDKKGKVIWIYDEKNEIPICLFYIFYEYSDWRNSIFWWVYDLLVNIEYSEYCDANMEKFIFSLVKLNYDELSCGIRFITNSENQSFLENTVLNKSHYIIYEKNI